MLLAASCGGGDDGGRTATAPANGSLRVVAKEYSFDPSHVVVRGPGTLRVTLVNDGSLAHDWKLFKDDRELGGVPAFPSGQTKSAEVRVARGKYEFICTVGDHAELGMKGTLTVD